MTDSMKFGPEWLRNMKSDNSLVAPAPTVMSTIKMAEFRYGREEMLALFDRSILPPDPLKQMQALYVEKTQLPLALVQMTDDETRMWNRGINSDVALRLSKPGAGIGVGGGRGTLGGRGGSVDRGRGRARGSYHYSRGLSYEESDTVNGFNNRPHMRTYDRTQSGGSWGERNGGDQGDYTATSPRKEYGGGGGSRGGPADNWRRHRGAGEDDEGWRATRTEKWGRGSSNSWRDGESWDRSRGWDEGATNSHPPPRKPWDSEENNLPEWAMENPSESGGSFDASGAFHGGTTFSDDEDKTMTRTEQTKSQPRPTPHSKKEPPNIINGTHPLPQTHTETGRSEHEKASGGGGGPLRQSQSATNLPPERNHPLTSSASFSGVNNLTSHPPTQREEMVTRPIATSPPHPPQPLVDKPPEVLPASPMLESKPVEKTSQEEEIEQRLLDAADVFVSRLMDEEERDPPPPAAPSPPPPPTPQPDTFWFYQDPQGNVQGPFQSSEMYEWFSSGYFKGTLLVRRACDERYSPLSEMMKMWNGIPFILDYYLVPPIKNTEPIMPSLPVLEDSLMLQYQIQQRVMMQQRQTACLALAKLTQTEHFNALTLEQQQMLTHQAQVEMSVQAGLIAPHSHTPPPPSTSSNVLAMLHQLAQYQQVQQRGGTQVPVPQSEPIDPVQQLIQQMGLQNHARAASTPQNTPEDQRSIEQFMAAFRQRQANPQPAPPPSTMESVWGGGTPAFPAWSAPGGQPVPAPPPQSLWPDPLTKGIKTEQEILEEQLRAEEKKEELRKQEELMRLKEEEEKERQRQMKEEEELERKRKEEELERKRIQEEEERKKKEAAAAKKAEQDRLRKEEEKKRKEEEKRRKEEEKRKQEEEKKRAEEERKRLEEEKKREEMTKRQNEALKRLQEQQQQRAAKSGPAPWTTSPAPDSAAGASLADIQKTERKQQQQLREQQEMLKAYQDKHQQEQLKTSKSGSNLHLKWAENNKSNQPARVKSLAEIQAEEHERMAKQAEKEKAERMAVAKEVSLPATGSIWASANQSLPWSGSNTASVWGNTPPTVSNSVGARYWDEVSTKPAKPPAPLQQQQSAVKSQAKTKAKKEEASVMKLFEKQIPKTSKSEDFNKWCTKTLAAYAYTVDIPTFVDFLLAFESHKEVREYIRMYLGETKEANDFATEFIDRRSRLLSDQPSQRPEPPVHTNTNHFQEVKGKNKKVKKSKMTKVDSRILGFNVTAAPDRINVGDRDYGEGL